MKKLIRVSPIISLILFLVGYVSAMAAIFGTFTVLQTVANLIPSNDQDALYAVTQPNVTSGADTTQSALALVAQAPTTATPSAVTIDTNIVFTADVSGAMGNLISVQIIQTNEDLGPSANGTIVITKTGNAILATIQHNLNTDARPCCGIIEVTRASVVDALNMTSSGTVQGGQVTVTITDNVSDLVTASGGSGNKIGTVPQTFLVGGSDATTQHTTITIGGGIEVGDIFTAHLPGSVDVSYTAQAGNNADSVAAGLNAAILASTGYDGQSFISGVSSNVITLIAKTGGVAFTVTSDTTNRPASVQQSRITISGTVEQGDEYRAILPGSVIAFYTVTEGDDTTDDVAAGLNAAIQASTGYSVQEFTSNASGNVITFTAKAAGTGFSVTSQAINRPADAQTVIFIPAFVTAGETFRATINGTSYEYLAVAGNTVQTIVEALAPLIDANPAVSCSEDDLKITCIASIPGTVFTFAATVVDVTPPHIFLNGPETVTIFNTNGYVDESATASDPAGVVGFVTTGLVNLNEKGTYTLTYTATDAQGLQSSVSRSVNVKMASGGGSGGSSSGGGQVLGAATTNISAIPIASNTFVTTRAMTESERQAQIAAVKSSLISLITQLIILLQSQLGVVQISN